MSIKKACKFVDEATKKIWVQHVQTHRVMHHLYEHHEIALEVLEFLEYMKPFL